MSKKEQPELIAYPLGGGAHKKLFRRADRLRQWQLDTPEAYATRCLPLNIANCHGWEALCAGGFDAVWDGGSELDAIEIIPHGDGSVVAQSHFGGGILTFNIGVLFRTSRGNNLMIQGPVNAPKDGIQGLTGIIETDWSPYSLTMNWKFTRPGRVRFLKGEPFCHFFPIPRGHVDQFKVEIRDLAKTLPETAREYREWSETRKNFNRSLKAEESEAVKKGWQKLYYRGLSPDEKQKEKEHQIKLKLSDFKDVSDFEYEGVAKIWTLSPLPVSACLAVLNEEMSIGRYLDVVAPRVGEVIILDLGSGDRTIKKIREAPFKNVHLIKRDGKLIETPLTTLAKAAKFDNFLLLQAEDRVLPDFWEKLPEYLNKLEEECDGIQHPVYVLALPDEPSNIRLQSLFERQKESFIATGTSRMILCRKSAAEKADEHAEVELLSADQMVISIYPEGHKCRNPEYLARKMLAEAKGGEPLDEAIFGSLTAGFTPEQINQIHSETEASHHVMPHDFWWGESHKP